MFVGYLEIEAEEVGTFADGTCIPALTTPDSSEFRPMRTYVDNFFSSASSPQVRDLNRSSILFLAKDKNALKTGLASGPQTQLWELTSPLSQIVVIYGHYSADQKPSAFKRFKSVITGKLKKDNDGDRNKLNRVLHMDSTRMLKYGGVYVMVTNVESLCATREYDNYRRGWRLCSDDSILPGKIAKMLNMDRTVAPNTRTH